MKVSRACPTLRQLLPHTDRDNYGSASESLCQLIEWMEKEENKNRVLRLAKPGNARSMVDAIKSLLLRSDIDSITEENFAEGLALLKNSQKELAELVQQQKAA